MAKIINTLNDQHNLQHLMHESWYIMICHFASFSWCYKVL